MRKILLLVLSLMIISMTSCSGVPGASNASGVTPNSDITHDTEKTNMPSFPAASDGVSRPAYAVEADRYTFITDFKSVYKMENKTGKTTKIFTSDDDILCIMEYLGYIFVQSLADGVYRMDYDGNNISTIKYINIIFGADRYIYYQNGSKLKRMTASGEEDEFISDTGFESDYIGYYNGKVYFQEKHKIFTLSKDGDKTYFCDGGLHSMRHSILILEKDKEFYRKDVETGNECKVYSYKGLYDYDEYVIGEYIGKYKENEYYLMDGKILSINIDGNKIAGQETLPFKYVEYATISNGWIYTEYSEESLMFSKYNLITKQKDFISKLPYMTNITECNNHLYYVDYNENGLFQIDLNDNSCKQIYSGKMYVQKYDI